MRAIITALFLILFSESAVAEWTRVLENDETTFYLDLERIRKQDGSVYYWTLADYRKITKFGDLSAMSYKQGDCKKFRVKALSVLFYSEPMGSGIQTYELGEDENWRYPMPDTVLEAILATVCNE